MATSPETTAEESKRKRQRQLDALSAKAAFDNTDAAVAATATAGAYAALCVHILLVAAGAWLLTRGGPVRGFSTWSQIGAVVMMVDAILCGVLLPTMVRVALGHAVARMALIASAAIVALTTLPTVLVSVFGEIPGLPFRHILYVGKGGLWMLGLLGICALYGAASIWLAWRLGTQPAGLLRTVAGPDELAEFSAPVNPSRDSRSVLRMA